MAKFGIKVCDKGIGGQVWWPISGKNSESRCVTKVVETKHDGL